ncbi:MipA/OmpV family protein [uncultured Roseobacter sp.]|uniref:MipA/OmpV family protein n=1 Tax=uncultured Roseobacter sp. TaxID=114847 RepID=UPI00262A3F8C|nr:MipA/OmpV family protein [uncultured Roseobacter sp.]
MTSNQTVGALCTLAIFAPTSAFADGPQANGQWVAGALLGYSRDIYEGEGGKLSGVPYLSYSTGRLSIGFEGITYRAYQSDAFKVALVLAPGASPDFPDDNPIFAGLDRGTAIDVGGTISFSFDRFYLSGAVLHDISSEHEGYQIETKIGAVVQTDPFTIDAGIGARYRDAKLSNFLIGVAAAEANTNRAAYDAGSTVEPFLSVSITMPLSEKTSLTGGFEYSLLSQEIRDSPLVGRDSSYGIGVGIIHRF